MKVKQKNPKVVRLVESRAEREAPNAPAVSEAFRIFVEGKRLVVDLTDGVELRCGDASLIMTKEGKVIIDAEFISVNSEGALRLRGASVDMD